MLLSLLALAALAADPSPTCADGRVVGPATDGRCCWPGQAWSDTKGRCEGPPVCPPGWAAAGDDCVRTPPAPGASTVSGPPPGAPAPAAAPAAPSRPDTFDGAHFFLGLHAGAGTSIVSVNPNPAVIDGAMLVGVQLGGQFGRAQLRLEVAPVSMLPSVRAPGGWGVTVTGGGYIRMNDSLSWPMRAGVGAWGSIDPDTPSYSDAPYLQAQADLIGIAWNHGPWIVEANLPTYRFLTNLDDQFIYHLTFQVGFAYVFGVAKGAR